VTTASQTRSSDDVKRCAADPSATLLDVPTSARCDIVTTRRVAALTVRGMLGALAGRVLLLRLAHTAHRSSLAAAHTARTRMAPTFAACEPACAALTTPERGVGANSKPTVFKPAHSLIRYPSPSVRLGCGKPVLSGLSSVLIMRAAVASAAFRASFFRDARGARSVGGVLCLR